jgi:hypothetical protein
MSRTPLSPAPTYLRATVDHELRLTRSTVARKAAVLAEQPGGRRCRSARVIALASAAAAALAAAVGGAQAIALEPPIVPQEGQTYPLGTRVTGPCDPNGDPDGGVQSAIEYQGYWDSKGGFHYKDYLDLHNDWANSGSPSDGWEIRAVRLRDAAGRLLPKCAPLTLRHPGRYELCVNVPGPEGEEVCDRTVHFQAARFAAHAGGPYRVTRGHTVTLNGSKSSPRKKITRWTWSVKPGDNCGGLTLAHSELRGETVTFTALCDLAVTLTVTNTKGEDSKPAKAAVEVQARNWKTPFTHEVRRNDPRAPLDQPLVSVFSRPDAAGLIGGKNRSACNDSDDYRKLLCPWVPAPRTMLGHHYAMKVVRERGKPEPFDGRVYIVDPKTTINRVAALNPYLLPGGKPYDTPPVRWYDVNKGAKLSDGSVADVDGFLAALYAHEGLGIKGNPLSGHSGAMRKLMRDQPRTYDPRQGLEGLMATRQDDLQRDADKRLREVQNRLAEATDDPLPRVWQGSLYFLNDEVLRNPQSTAPTWLDVLGSIGVL